jgi:hypothetical protein
MLMPGNAWGTTVSAAASMLEANRRHIKHIAFNQFDSIVFGQYASGHHHLIAVRGDSRSCGRECTAHG